MVGHLIHLYNVINADINNRRLVWLENARVIFFAFELLLNRLLKKLDLNEEPESRQGCEPKAHYRRRPHHVVDCDSSRFAFWRGRRIRGSWHCALPVPGYCRPGLWRACRGIRTFEQTIARGIRPRPPCW